MTARRATATGWIAACLSAASVAFAAPPALAEAPANRHLDCAGTYLALSSALPYLPGVFLMFTIAPRSGRAQNAYERETNAVSRGVVRLAAQDWEAELLAKFAAGEITLEDLTARAHACDAFYGYDPAPTTLDEVLEYE